MHLLYITNASGNQARNIVFAYFSHGHNLLFENIMYLFKTFIIIFIIFRDTDGKFPFLYHDL